MKIYIITAAIFFCSNALTMDKTKHNQLSTLGNHLPLISKSSGFSETSYILQNQTHLAHNIINAHHKTQMRNKKCTVGRLLSPCLLLQPKPLKSKL